MTTMCPTMMATRSWQEDHDDICISPGVDYSRLASMILRAFLPLVLTSPLIIDATNDHDNHFDFLMFTQLWPVTGCIDWEDRSEENTCNIHRQDHWTIHGIWPTRKNEIGPLFCNSSANFNPQALEPIMDDLFDKWTDVRNTEDKYNFWTHEWLKHGTCAMQLPSMNTEYKYFSKALELHEKYNIYELLKSGSIVPGQGYKYEPVHVLDQLIEKLHDQDRLAVKPAINCQHDKFHKEVPMFYEVIVCLDKNFNRIGCEDTKGGLFGTCSRHSGARFEYPSLSSGDSISGWSFWALFLMTLTLALIGATFVIGVARFFRRRRSGLEELLLPTEGPHTQSSYETI